jgi:hypothetical protein
VRELGSGLRVCVNCFVLHCKLLDGRCISTLVLFCWPKHHMPRPSNAGQVWCDVYVAAICTTACAGACVKQSGWLSTACKYHVAGIMGV